MSRYGVLIGKYASQNIGYDSYELDKPSALDVMEHVGREALVEAYQRHEPTRETRSLLFCVRVSRSLRGGTL